ncbi:MAG: hypothetical protein IPM24_02220 [Bryobacterales bacterium]|nr:hypothetical protein [Bryobacterales bacterium]
MTGTVIVRRNVRKPYLRVGGFPHILSVRMCGAECAEPHMQANEQLASTLAKATKQPSARADNVRAVQQGEWRLCISIGFAIDSGLCVELDEMREFSNHFLAG